MNQERANNYLFINSILHLVKFTSFVQKKINLKPMGLRFLLTMIICLLGTFGLSAQSKFFLEVSGNYSLSQDMEEFYNQPNPVIPYLSNQIILSEHFEGKPGIDLNVGMNKNIYKKFNLTVGIGISAVQFKRTFSVDIQNGDPYTGMQTDLYTGFFGYRYLGIYDDYPYAEDPDVISDEPRALYDRGYNWLGNSEDLAKVGQTEILYFNIPVGIQYPLTKKLLLGMGIKNSIITYSRQVKQVDYLRVYTDKSSDGLSNYLLSGDVSLQYKLFKQIWLSTAYNHNFTPVYDETQRMAGDLRLKTFRLGLKYDL